MRLVSQSGSQSDSKPTTLQVTYSVHQPVCPLISQSVSQLLSLSCCQSVCFSVCQSDNESITQTGNQLGSQSVRQCVSQSMSHPFILYGSFSQLVINKLVNKFVLSQIVLPFNSLVSRSFKQSVSRFASYLISQSTILSACKFATASHSFSQLACQAIPQSVSQSSIWFASQMVRPYVSPYFLERNSSFPLTRVFHISLRRLLFISFGKTSL